MDNLTSYSDLIGAAFINPLRSVMIIDDDYPTWEEIFDKDNWAQNEEGDLVSPNTEKNWTTNPTLPMDLIKQFRDHDKGLLIDINDGRPPNAPSPDEIASHLFQSDLLVLDYQLEGEHMGGERAINIATSLLTQDHFNLIVVHTNKDNLAEPYSEILLRLLEPCEPDQKISSRVDKGKEALEEFEDEGAATLTTDLKRKFLDQHYLFMRHQIVGKKAVGRLMKGDTPFEELSRIMDEAGLPKQHFSNVLIWLFFDFQKRKAKSFGKRDNKLQWSVGDEVFWIRSERGFVTFARKKDTTDLIGALQTALESWQPTPSRLLSAKYRHALDDFGVSAEDTALSNKHVFSRFYKDIINSETGPQRQTLIRQHTRQQTEQIGASIEEKIARFGMEIARLDNDEQNPFLSHYNVDLGNQEQAIKATYDFNHYVSTISVHGHHLTSGHIFELEEKKWIVVSPACDLVPGQKRMGFNEPHTQHRPFIAIELHPCSNLTNEEINSGGFVFLKDSGEVKPYCTFARQSPAIERLPKLGWQNFIALNDGVFKEGYSLDLLRVVSKPKSLGSKKMRVTITSQLRSEFALNLIHRLGITMTRVGLSFVGNHHISPGSQD